MKAHAIFGYCDKVMMYTSPSLVLRPRRLAHASMISADSRPNKMAAVSAERELL